MYHLRWELRGPDSRDTRREATAMTLPLTCSLSHALVEAATILNRENARLHSLTLEEYGVSNNEYVVKATLMRYEREGL